MGGTTSAVSLPNDAACEDVLRTFISENPERAERLLRRAHEQLRGHFRVCMCVLGG